MRSTKTASIGGLQLVLLSPRQFLTLGFLAAQLPGGGSAAGIGCW